MSSKRLLLGVAILIAAQVLLNNIASSLLTETMGLIAARSVVIALLAAFAGGLVARKGIVIPALAVWLALWAVTVYFLYAIAAPVDPNPLPMIAQHNWVAFIGSGFATVVGAMLGQAIATKRATQATAT